MKKFLIVVDMQNDFIDGSLGTSQAQAIVRPAAERILARRREGYQILVTRDTHGENYLNTSEGRHLPVSHCIRGTEGWEIHPEIAPLLEDCLILDKPSFGSLELADTVASLAGAEEAEIEMLGLCTDICVISNALLLKARLPEAALSVVSSCCAGVTPESHEAALLAMKMCQVEILP